MPRNILLIVLIVAVLAGGGFLFYKQRAKKTPESAAPIPASQELVPVTRGSANGDAEKRYHQTVTIDSQSFFFNPDVFRVKRGEKAAIRVRAQGDHTFVIDELKVHAKTPDGVTTKIEFTPEKEGAFRYYCDKPGHQEAGQEGMVIVEQ